MKPYSLAAAAAMLCSAALCSCQHDEVDTYSGVKAGIFIQEIATTDIYGNPMSYRVEKSFSFQGYDASFTEYKMGFTVRTMGMPVDYDRPFTVEVVPEETTAVLGEDFELPENPVIPAGQSTAAYKVTMKRTAKLLKGNVSVTVRLLPNEHFETPIGEFKNSSAWNVDGKMMSALQFRVSWDEKYTEPFTWSFYGDSYFGPFTVNKFFAVNEAMGWTISSWNDGTVAYGKLDYAARKTQKYLQKLADEGKPAIDDDGSYIQLASGYQVNYSAYL